MPELAEPLKGESYSYQAASSTSRPDAIPPLPSFLPSFLPFLFSAAGFEFISPIAPIPKISAPAMAPIRATQKEIHPLRSPSDDPGKDKDSTMHDGTTAQDDKPKRKRQSQSTYELLIVLSLSAFSGAFCSLPICGIPSRVAHPRVLARSPGPVASRSPGLVTDGDIYPQAVTRAGPARYDVRETIQTSKPLVASTVSALVSHVHTNISQRSAVLQICLFPSLRSSYPFFLTSTIAIFAVSRRLRLRLRLHNVKPPTVSMGTQATTPSSPVPAFLQFLHRQCP